MRLNWCSLKMGQSSTEGGSVHTLMDMVVIVGGLSTDCVLMDTCTTCTCTGHVKVQSAVTVCYVQSLLRAMSEEVGTKDPATAMIT